MWSRPLPKWWMLQSRTDNFYLMTKWVCVRFVYLGELAMIFLKYHRKNIVCSCHACITSNVMTCLKKKCLVGNSKIKRRNSTMICLLRYLWSDFLLRYQGRLALSKSKLRSFFKNFPFSILTFDPVLSHRITQEEGIVHHGW